MINQERDRVLENNRIALVFRNRLPMYCYRGVEYFVDFRGEELRPADEPHKAYPFIYLCDEQLKAELRGLRAEFSSCLYYMMGLDD